VKEVKQSMKNDGSLQEKKYALERLLDYAPGPGFLRKKLYFQFCGFKSLAKFSQNFPNVFQHCENIHKKEKNIVRYQTFFLCENLHPCNFFEFFPCKINDFFEKENNFKKSKNLLHFYT